MPCHRLPRFPHLRLWYLDALADHSTAPEYKQTGNWVYLPELPFRVNTKRQLFVHPALLYPECHASSYGERSWDWGPLKVFRFASSVLW